MSVQKNISLLPYNSFHLDVNAAEFVSVETMEELRDCLNTQEPKLILGGGSNILLTKPLNGLVVHNELKGIAIEKEDESHVWLRVASGEIWHDLVLYVVNKGWGGIENLALIPGTVGA